MTGADRLPSDGVTPAGGEGFSESFDGEVLVMLRRAVAAHASRLGMGDDQVYHLVLVVQELAANAVRHGGGRGIVRLWRAGDQIICEVSDPGHARADLTGKGLTAPYPGDVGGRGLWLARQFTHGLDIHTGDAGTRVIATFNLAGTTSADQLD